MYDPVISDHFAVHCRLNIDMPPVPKQIIKYRKLRSVNADNFCRDNINSSLCQSPSTSFSELYGQYENVVSYFILDNYTPLRTKIVKQRPVAPWFTEDIAVEKAKRRTLERRWQLTKNSADLDLYLSQCRLVKDIMINSAKMRYYTSLIKNSKSDQ